MANLVEIVIKGVNESGKAFAEADAQGHSLSSTLTKVGAVGAVALGAVAVAAVDMATKYQTSTTRLVTSAGESVKNIDLVRKGMLDMSSQVGTSALELSKGMYTVESAGFHGAQGLLVLKAAAQGAKDEGAQLATVANAVTDVLVDFHLKASDAATATSQLVTAVSFGKTTFEDFSGSMSSILPLAASLHLKLADVTGVLAEMTAHGMTADRASMDMANAMRSLAAPTGAMSKAYKEFGISASEVGQKLGTVGLAGTMQWLSQVAHAGTHNNVEYTAAMKAMMGTAPGLITALMTTGENASATNKAIHGIATASKDASGDVKGFSEIQKTLGFQVSQLKSYFEALMITIGSKLIPVLTDATHFLADHRAAVTDVVIALAALAGVMATYFVIAKTIQAVTVAWGIATKAAAAAQWLLNVAMDANPIGLIIVGVAALVGGFILLWTHFKGFRDFWIDAWNIIKESFLFVFNFIKDHWKLILAILLGPVGLAVDAIVTHWHAIEHGVEAMINFIKAHWRLIIEILLGPLGVAIVLIIDHFHQIQNVVMTVVRFIKSNWSTISSILTWPFKAAWNTISWIFGQIENAISRTISMLDSIVSHIPGGGVLSNVAGFFGLATGGIVGAASGGARSNMTMVGEHGRELVKLPAGSQVFSNPDTESMLGGGGGRGGELHIVFDGGDNELMSALAQAMRKHARYYFGGNAQQAFGYGG